MGQQFAKSCPRHDRILYKPQGVHELDNIDLRKLKKLIKARRLAPFWKQKDDCQDGREECPICNYWYPVINTASCCGARLCTECFVMCQSSHDPPGKAACPYCKKVPFSVRYVGCKGEAQLRRERMERQIVAEAKLRHLKEYAVGGSQRMQQQQQSSYADSSADLMPRQPSMQSLQSFVFSEPGWLDDHKNLQRFGSTSSLCGRSGSAALPHPMVKVSALRTAHTAYQGTAVATASMQLQSTAGSLIDCIVQDASQALSLRACILASPFWEVLPAGRPQGAELALLWQLSHSTLWCPSYGSCCMCGAYELRQAHTGLQCRL
ncbi:hypothetical protein COO60DRAFT_1625064 [Scenedesmus sp. NREL 46B-D3]|nr:hypothetical protein COO60DRAFT_1625064 [Scenedesmus sp. NREL 46B-D3]